MDHLQLQVRSGVEPADQCPSSPRPNRFGSEVKETIWSKISASDTKCQTSYPKMAKKRGDFRFKTGIDFKVPTTISRLTDDSRTSNRSPLPDDQSDEDITQLFHLATKTADDELDFIVLRALGRAKDLYLRMQIFRGN